MTNEYYEDGSSDADIGDGEGQYSPRGNLFPKIIQRGKALEVS